ncbi:hypothetical protein PHYPO_G00239010 [Pangasianodon hypophthalmus]|uniref:Immunoglobulin domain-containing protein n=1 Tax=Pangasianodon hypophthalmus TaxID=310915 RepID=A0A5N5NCI6_PANHP|nr:hypothetical protein PHYPO_G00239010 [Pangasianodon hypophthalmus]
MEVHLLFFLLSYGNIHIVSTNLSNLKSPDTWTVREKDNISLLCNIKGHEEVAWYRLSFDTLTLLISAQKARTVKSLPVYYNRDESRFVLKPDGEITTATFTIMNLTEDDLGLYFCGITAEPAQMHFGRATRLQFEDKKEETKETFSTQKTPGEEMENTGEASVCERVLMFGGVFMAALLLFLTTVVACSVIRQTKVVR